MTLWGDFSFRCSSRAATAHRLCGIPHRHYPDLRTRPLGFLGVSVIAATTTPCLAPYILPAAKMGHAGVVFAVGMVFLAGAVTRRQ